MPPTRSSLTGLAEVSENGWFCNRPYYSGGVFNPCVLDLGLVLVLFLYSAVFVTKRWFRLNKKWKKHAHRRRNDNAKLRSESIWKAVLAGKLKVEARTGDFDEESASSDEEDSAHHGNGSDGQGDDMQPLLDAAAAGDATDRSNAFESNITLPPPLLSPHMLHEHLPMHIKIALRFIHFSLSVVVLTLLFELFHIAAHVKFAGSSTSSNSAPILLVACLALLGLWLVVLLLMTWETNKMSLKPQMVRRTPRSMYKRVRAAGAGYSSVVHGFWMLSFLLSVFQLNQLFAHRRSCGTDFLDSVEMLVTLSSRTAALLTVNLLSFPLFYYRCTSAYEIVLEKAWQRNLEQENNRLAGLINPEGFFLPDSGKYTPPSTMADFADKMSKLWPFIWPSGASNRGLQSLICLCGVVLVIGRLVNLLVPLQYKYLIDELGGLNKVPDSSNITAAEHWTNLAMGTRASLASYFTGENVANDGDTLVVPLKSLLIFVGLRFLQGGVGLLSAIQNYLWIPVGQFTTREISVQLFEHLHHLSLRFHLNRKTGEILRVQDRGVSSIVSLLSSILFNIVPTLVDIFVACAYFTMQFDMAFGFIVFVTMSLYIGATIVLTDWRTQYRRNANLLDNAMQAKAVDSLLNFETVKYYNAENYEVRQYVDAIKEYQVADWQSSVSLSILNTAQNVIISLGLLSGCLLCASRIANDGSMSVGDFVLYLSYITQLYGPLNWFGTYYRVIQKNFVDMEKMLDLFQEPEEVVDAPNAAKLDIKAGDVVFENVCFSYDPRLATLKDISFRIRPGSTVALVGPSGSGKSSLLRLLFRFYDVNSGRILIDGQDIRSVTQSSLRGAIGVVPQDTVLFNNTVMYNIRYGRPTATDAEVYEAAVKAQIHDRILSFPDGYDTTVGERGLRLSGGEKQRVAIARTLLKNPIIVMLDEATSALDTETERDIQTALQQMTQNRTKLVIAHRLSTVINADLILVLKDGRIVERGSHNELLKQPDSVYYSMWTKQLRDDEGERLSLVQSGTDGVVLEDKDLNLEVEDKGSSMNSSSVTEGVAKSRSGKKGAKKAKGV